MATAGRVVGAGVRLGARWIPAPGRHCPGAGRRCLGQSEWRTAAAARRPVRRGCYWLGNAYA